jgi:intein/homing endonuclease
MICNCMYCGKELDRIPSRIKRNNVFCNASCQLKFEYDTGVRDRVNIGVKARKVSQAKREPKYLKINKITKVKDSVKVYNFSVDKDESYLANDLIVHNCRSVLNYSVVGDEE